MKLTPGAIRRITILSKSLEEMAHRSADGAEIEGPHFQQILAEVEALCVGIRKEIGT